MVVINNDWDDFLSEETKKDYYLKLREFLKNEYKTKTIYPPAQDIFNAFRYTSYNDTNVVILGQDPYINPGEAHGLAFSVQIGAKVPPSLRNVYKELETDLGLTIPNSGYLVKWAKQGVLLLNSILTVEHKLSKAHAKKGWEVFTASVIKQLDKKNTPVVFLLWGADAIAKAELITNPIHLVQKAAHPSPLAGGKFFGCKHFSKTNEFLLKNGLKPIDWQI